MISRSTDRARHLLTCSGCKRVFPNVGAIGNHGKYDRTCTPEMRFWGKVDKSAGADACWTWTGAVTSKWGYGCVVWMRRVLGAHKVTWLLTNGDPGELCVLHRCDNRVCVNPAHLFLGTKKDNAHDKIAKGRDTTRGEGNMHAKLTEDNVLEIRRSFKRISPHKSNAKELAQRFGVSAHHVQQLAETRGYWKHLQEPNP